MHEYMHTLTHLRHTCTRTRTLTRMHASMHAHMHTRPPARPPARSHAHGPRRHADVQFVCGTRQNVDCADGTVVDGQVGGCDAIPPEGGWSVAANNKKDAGLPPPPTVTIEEYDATNYGEYIVYATCMCMPMIQSTPHAHAHMCAPIRACACTRIRTRSYTQSYVGHNYLCHNYNMLVHSELSETESSTGGIDITYSERKSITGSEVLDLIDSMMARHQWDDAHGTKRRP